MDLREYPRPHNDTGIGIHWSAGFAAAVGLGQIKDFWLPELQAMGVKWVKVANHDGALTFIELLLRNDIMPVVRLYRPQPNPGILDVHALQAVRDYVSLGVRYFEFNNEPNLGVEWQGGEVPPGAPQIVARNAIVDMEAILQRGGYPAVPALAPGGKWDLVGEICSLGRHDLFREPVWQAIHNYSINHPLDYPYDSGNQQGAPFTREYYERIAAEKWDGDAWHGWSFERINEQRSRDKNPGATAFDDPSCWLAYKRYDQLIRNQIGRSLPILSTENGYLVGERPDPRYPATTPLLHMAQTIEACRIMMGVSTRYEHAPDYYFCTAFWLLANNHLGSSAIEWEGQAWYSARWPEGRLPVVKALKSEPKHARVVGVTSVSTAPAIPALPLAAKVEDGGPGPGFSVVRCRVTGKIGWPVRIWTDGWGGTTQLSGSKTEYGADACEFSPLGAGRYIVEVRAGGASGDAPLAGRVEVVLPANRVTWVRFEQVPASAPTPAPVPVRRSNISGAVTNGEGLQVTLTGLSLNRQVMVKDGRYVFAELPAGSYRIAVLSAAPPKGVLAVKDKVAVNGSNSVRIDFTLPAPVAPKSLEHFLLVGAMARTKNEYLAVLRYVARFAPAVGATESDARQAKHVTILGSTAAVSAGVEQRLQRSGCVVHRISSDITGTLNRLVSSGQPY